MRNLLHPCLRSALALSSALAFASCDAAPEPDLATPESVLHDVDADVYLVSNIGGHPLDKDDNGAIVRVAPDDGRRTDWIRGGRDGVTLHAPKGMALVGDVLWVADIDVVRKFDRHSGAPLGEVPIAGSTFLNDVTAAADGTVFVSDSALDRDFTPNGTDAIWRIGTDGEVEALAKGEELGNPNGIRAHNGAVYVVSWTTGAFYQLDADGRRLDLAKAPQARLDGLVRVELATDDGNGGSRQEPVWLATSWAGSTIYQFSLRGGVKAMAVRVEQPADLGYDEKRRRLMVPLFGANRVHYESL